MPGTDAWQVGVQMFFSKHVTSPRIHKFAYKLTRGVVGSRLPGVVPPVLLLTANGRRSGKRRTTPLVYFRIDGNILVTATNSGEDWNPAWYCNLEADPDALVQIGAHQVNVRARFANGEVRRRLWAEITEVHPLFAAYQRRTTRTIPVVILEPAQ